MHETILMRYNSSTPDSVLKQIVMVSREIHTVVVQSNLIPGVTSISYRKNILFAIQVTTQVLKLPFSVTTNTFTVYVHNPL